MLVSNLSSAEITNFNTTHNKINSIINKNVKSSFTFSGLASYYNAVTAYIISNNKIEKINDDQFYILTPSQSLAIIGHHKIMIVSNIDYALSFKKNKLFWQEEASEKKIIDKKSLQVQLLLKSDLVEYSQPFQKLKYAHLWEPFRLLCVSIEFILLGLNSLHLFGWGVTIILFSFLFKIFILPINIFLIRSQKKVFYIQNSLASELEYIKSNFSGEEAHNKSIKAHKSKGVTPYYNLRPLFLSFVPIPFLISIFNVLGELDLISGHSFLWIKDLAYPDAIFYLDAGIPFLGNSINLLPILMTLLSVFGTIFHQNKFVLKKEINKQKLNLYIMALGFFLLFYPFPSAMVLYWTLANIWQMIQHKLILIFQSEYN
jgi:YidC/Oxa1 family membrane protein insertase